jgi:hypothetical protein
MFVRVKRNYGLQIIEGYAQVRKDVPMSSTSIARYAIVLGLITAVGPAGIDMYLPSLPSIVAPWTPRPRRHRRL